MKARITIRSFGRRAGQRKGPARRATHGISTNSAAAAPAVTAPHHLEMAGAHGSLHRAPCDGALAFGAVVIFAWWLAALASGPTYYRLFQDIVFSPLGVVVGFGLTWSMFQHMGSGIRHFIMDSGEGFDLVTSRRMALATFAFSAIATLAFWAFILLGRGY
jgi:succinate dehydrogenase / fumarate reductase cytochrome b subunit